MEHENKCFFSISLENGITITGENPYKVKNYLSDLRMAICQALNDEREKDNDNFWIENYEEMKNQLLDAIVTIYRNTEKN